MKNRGQNLKNDFSRKCFPVILRPFRGVLGEKWGCGVRSKLENAKREICLVPPEPEVISLLTAQFLNNFNYTFP